MFLERDDFEELNLFSYSHQKRAVVIDDVSDKLGWKNVRQELIRNTGVNPMPRVYVDEVTASGELILVHEHDGRDLELSYAETVVNQVKDLWHSDVKLFTVIEEETWEI